MPIELRTCTRTKYCSEAKKTSDELKYVLPTPTVCSHNLRVREPTINFSNISHRSRTHLSFSEPVMFSRLNTVALPGAPSFQSNNLSGHGDLLCFVRLTEVSIVQDEKFNKIALSRSQISEVL